MPKVTTHSLYPECIANLKLPIDAFYRESRSGVNIAKRNITTGLFGLGGTIIENDSRGNNSRYINNKIFLWPKQKNDLMGNNSDI